MPGREFLVENRDGENVSSTFKPIERGMRWRLEGLCGGRRASLVGMLCLFFLFFFPLAVSCVAREPLPSRLRVSTGERRRWGSGKQDECVGSPGHTQSFLLSPLFSSVVPLLEVHSRALLPTFFLPPSFFTFPSFFIPSSFSFFLLYQIREGRETMFMFNSTVFSRP